MMGGGGLLNRDGFGIGADVFLGIQDSFLTADDLVAVHKVSQRARF